jgi:quercetin dioxygenase-like cupin family protein
MIVCRSSRLAACSLVELEVVMSDTPEHESHHRPHTSSTAGPFMEFDLPAEIHRLHAETTWSTGRNARTLFKYDDFRVVLTALQARARVPEHKTEGRISVHVLSGHIQVRASGRTFSLRPGGLLALDQGVPHDLKALEESAFLLTIVWPGRG